MIILAMVLCTLLLIVCLGGARVLANIFVFFCVALLYLMLANPPT